MQTPEGKEWKTQMMAAPATHTITQGESLPPLGLSFPIRTEGGRTNDIKGSCELLRPLPLSLSVPEAAGDTPHIPRACSARANIDPAVSLGPAAARAEAPGGGRATGGEAETTGGRGALPRHPRPAVKASSVFLKNKHCPNTVIKRLGYFLTLLFHKSPPLTHIQHARACTRGTQ